MTTERDAKGNLRRPHFESDVPEYLLVGVSPAEKYQLINTSIAKQQNDWLITQALDSDKRTMDLEKKQQALETLRIVLQSRWSVVAWIALTFVVPLVLTVLSAWAWVKIAGKTP